MRISKDDVDVRMQIPGATIRQQMDFGSVDGYDRICGEYFSLAKGVDTRPLLKGLEGDACQSPHWGFVLRGKVTATDASGKDETATTNDLFYWPPGHNVRVDEDAELIMFSPQHEHVQVVEHMRAKVGA